jgi:hypothetical protein
VDEAAIREILRVQQISNTGMGLAELVNLPLLSACRYNLG